MQDEWEFDDDDDDDDDDSEEEKEREDQNIANVSASPVKVATTIRRTRQSSPANSSLSSFSISRASNASTRSRDSSSMDNSTGDRTQCTAGAATSPAASAASSFTIASSSQQSSSESKTTSTNSKGSYQPRTRAARMKAKGMPKKSPHRKVRFEISAGSSDASPSSAAAVNPSNHQYDQGYRSFATRPVLKSSRKSKYRKRMWNPEEDGDDSFLQRKKKSDGKKKSPANPIVHAASVDVYAIQDSVKVQRLADELRYCCDTLRHSRKAPRQLEAVADLSLLLSNRKNRQCLLFSHHQQGNDGDEASPLQILLKLMEWVHSKMGCSVGIARVGECEDSVCRTKYRRTRTEQNSPTAQIVQEGLPPSVVEAVGFIWHFLSMDCTMATESSSSNSAVARKLRETVLSDRHAMQGLLEMIVTDPYLDSSLTQEQTDCCSVAAGLSQESGSSLSSVPDSPDSTGSVDPTVTGRWLKRRRKLLGTTSALDAIPENGVQIFREDIKKTDDTWSYNSESITTKTQDDGSVTSSQATDVQSQLKKVLDKVKETIQDPVTKGHRCGSEKNELLSRLPLLSLCRIVSGKFEGDDKSCIDDDFGESQPDEGEGELSQNPLLRTNAILADSGAIPFIARATSNAAIAITEQITIRDSCDGCEAYLRWKFSKLTSLVDDACLLTDENRAAFATEGFVAETGGYLLINIATALRALLEKEKLFDQTGWGEVAISALRSLTSLTHDNEMAARDLQASSIKLTGKQNCNSLSVVALVLYEASRRDGDMTIFCLNTMANILESGGSWKPFSKLTVGEEKESFLQWLTKYVVSETKSFQDAVVESSFVASEDRHSERRLDKHENEALMMAGNAFIFLAYVLVGASTKTSNDVQEEILAQLPGAQESAKLLFIKNTLKAFCNLYHFSVGALSLAIVAPVNKLLSDLESAYGV